MALKETFGVHWEKSLNGADRSVSNRGVVFRAVIWGGCRLLQLVHVVQ